MIPKTHFDLGCGGCPICGTGDCRETGPVVECTNHPERRLETLKARLREKGVKNYKVTMPHGRVVTVGQE
jgi:hypothetical protein